MSSGFSWKERTMTLSASPPKRTTLREDDVSMMVQPGSRMKSAASDRDVPRVGFPKFKYGFSRGFGRVVNIIPFVKYTAKVPTPTQADQKKYEVERLHNDIAQMMWFVKLRAMHVIHVFAVFNDKGGGGKSPFMALLAGLYQAITGYGAIIVDLNQDGSTLPSILGVSRGNTITLDQAMKVRKELINLRAIRHYFAIHWKSSLRFLADSRIDPATYSEDDYIELLDNLQDAGGDQFIDNGTNLAHPAAKAAFKVADAPFFSGVWGNDGSMQGVAKALQTIALRGRSDARKIRDQGVVVINAVPSGISKEEVFLEFQRQALRALVTPRDTRTNRRIEDPDLKEQALQLLMKDQARLDNLTKNILRVDIDRFFTVPHNDHIAEFCNKDEITMDVALETLGLETVHSVMLILKYVYGDGIITVDDFGGEIIDFPERELDTLEGIVREDEKDRHQADAVDTGYAGLDIDEDTRPVVAKASAR